MDRITAWDHLHTGGPAPATPGLTHPTCPPTRGQRSPSLVHPVERPPSLPPFPGGQRVKECSKSTSHQRAMPGTPPTEVLGKCWALGRAHATAGQDPGAGGGGRNHLPRASRDHRPGACGGDRRGATAGPGSPPGHAADRAVAVDTAGDVTVCPLLAWGPEAGSCAPGRAAAGGDAGAEVRGPRGRRGKVAPGPLHRAARRGHLPAGPSPLPGWPEPRGHRSD